MPLRFDRPDGRIPLVVGVVGSEAELAEVLSSPPSCDVIELRGDLLGKSDAWFPSLLRLKQQQHSVLLTIRQSAEGGRWTGADSERFGCLEQCIPFVDAVDLEIATPGLSAWIPAAQRVGVHVVASFHDFCGTPSDERLIEILQRGRASGADIVKMAVLAEDAPTLERLSAFCRTHSERPLCMLGMGALGPRSRIELPLAGSCLTYGYIREQTAPGQLAASEIRRQLIERMPAYRVAHTGHRE